MDNNTNTNVQEITKNRLYFNPRDWALVSDAPGYRTFIEGPDGILSESFMIGDWGWNWTEIASNTLTLEKHTKYEFVFWLNGGENDQNNETCQFAVLFDGDYDGRLIYNLNRSYIKPLKKVSGWELYCIPFTTGDNENTQLRFMAMRAPMTVMSAGDPEGYTDLADSPDEFEDKRPQRHNIVFNDGWPRDAWYSTENLRKGCMDPKNGTHRIDVSQKKPFSVYDLTLEDIKNLTDEERNFIMNVHMVGGPDKPSNTSNKGNLPFTLTLEDIKNLEDEERDLIMSLYGWRFGEDDPGQCPW